jgi:hypothetical protein
LVRILRLLACALALASCKANTTSNNANLNGIPCGKVVCKSSDVCVDDVCVPKGGENKADCNVDNPSGACVTGYSCVAGVCYPNDSVPPPCSAGVNGTCPDGQACVNGSCTAIGGGGCTSTNQSGLCRGGETCIGGKCWPATGDTADCSASNPNGYCPANQVCTNGACVTIFATCVSVSNGSCSQWYVCSHHQCVGPAPPHQCSAAYPDGVCPDGEVCVSGTCTPINQGNGCGANVPGGLCPPGSACVGHDCVVRTPENICSTLATAGTCPAGQTCTDTTCVDVKCADGGFVCPIDQQCVSRACVPFDCGPQHPNGKCTGAGETCDQGLCTTGGTIAPTSPTGTTNPTGSTGSTGNPLGCALDGNWGTSHTIANGTNFTTALQTATHATTLDRTGGPLPSAHVDGTYTYDNSTGQIVFTNNSVTTTDAAFDACIGVQGTYTLTFSDCTHFTLGLVSDTCLQRTTTGNGATFTKQ